MLLLFADSLLLLFITASLGVIGKKGLEKIFNTTIRTDLLGIFLTGLIFSTAYFNILSFWWPVNYLSLIPLLIASLLFLGCNNHYRSLYTTAIRQFRVLLRPPYLLPAICLFIILLCYGALPPMNIDSPDYHYKTIQWYETYKVVPGLANVHGRYAFDSASFVIQAAYSFCSLTGQAIYPLNGVLTALLLGWILTRIFRNRTSYTGLVYLIALALFARPLLINLSSPTSDTLVLVCIGYSLLRLFELLLPKATSLSTALVPLLIILYAPLAKLSAYATLFMLPCFFYILPKSEKRKTLYIVMIALAGLLYLPWMGRNYIMSGYLVYPFPYLDLFHPDWKAPKEVLLVDYYYIRMGAKLYPLGTARNWAFVQSVSFRQWFPYWLSAHFKFKIVTDLWILLIALFSPLLWFIAYTGKKKPGGKLLIPWLIIYTSIWIWIATSAEHRFGSAYLSLAIVLPLLYLAQGKRATGKLQNMMTPIFFTLFSGYYLYTGIHQHRACLEDRNYGFTLHKNWLLPLQNYRSTINNNLADFPYKTLNSGVRLYLSDSSHDCLNAPLPCMSWRYGEIEMRGSRMDKGFRNVKNEVKKYYPFIK